MPLRRIDIAPSVTRVYWSPEDDLVLWNHGFIWLAMHQFAPEHAVPEFFYRKGVFIGLPWVREYDAIPEHVGWIARNIGLAVGRVPVEFDIRTQGMWWLRDTPGMGHTSPATWMQSGAYVSLARYPAGDRYSYAGPDSRLESWRPGMEDWAIVDPRILPPETKLHLARDTEEGGLEAIISYVTADGREVLERVRGGDSAPLVIAEGPFRNVVASPDRTRLFGTFDRNGRFTRAPGEMFSGAEEFWLTYLEGMNGVEKFYFLDEAKYLLVKYREGDEVRISILENDGAAVTESYSICRGDAA